MNARTRRLFPLLALAAFLADQTSKYGVFRWLYNDGQGKSREVVEGWFCLDARFDPSAPSGGGLLTAWSGPIAPRVNKGALFGLGGEYETQSNLFFAAVSAAAALFIVVWGKRRSAAGDGLLTFALGLILGGTLGNFYDRVVFGGVRDFLYFYRINWPVFNVADCCLVVGAGLLLFQALFLSREPEPAPAVPAAAPAPAAS